ILDEPTSALDPVVRVQVRELLLGAKAAGKTIFLSSHMLSEIELICDHIAFLVKGRVAQQGTTRDLLQDDSAAEVEFRNLPGERVEAVLGNGSTNRGPLNGTFKATIRAAEQR